MFIAVLLWPSVQITSTFICPSLSLSSLPPIFKLKVILYFRTTGKDVETTKKSWKHFILKNCINGRNYLVCHSRVESIKSRFESCLVALLTWIMLWLCSASVVLAWFVTLSVTSSGHASRDSRLSRCHGVTGYRSHASLATNTFESHTRSHE